MTIPFETGRRSRRAATVQTIRDGQLERGHLAIPSLVRTLTAGGTALGQLVQHIQDTDLGEQVCRALDLLHGIKGRVIVTGVGKSGHIGRKLAATLSSTGTPSYFIHPTEAVHGDLGMVASEDLLLALSWSGETQELAAVISYAKRFGVPVIAITSQGGSTLAKAANVPLVLPCVVEACPLGLAPTTSTLLQLAMGDALAIALLERRGFSAADFHNFHPGGKLGAKLTRVRDVMHADVQLAMPLGSRISDAILVMTGNGFGVAAICNDAGKLEGIITDGDLRRHMAGSLLSAPVEQVMSRNPKVVHGDTIAQEALEIMTAKKVGALIVVDDDKPIGIVRLHDLLKIGAA